jgi:chromosome segregation ATPase
MEDRYETIRQGAAADPAAPLRQDHGDGIVLARMEAQNKRLLALLEEFSHSESQRRMLFEERLFEMREQLRQALEDKSRLEHALGQSRTELAAMSVQAAGFRDRAADAQGRLETSDREMDSLRRELSACRERLTDSERGRLAAQDDLRELRTRHEEMQARVEHLQNQWRRFTQES